ncbi:MAG: ferritin-like domain-containing protein [Cyclobacteriaceae bacterium]
MKTFFDKNQSSQGLSRRNFLVRGGAGLAAAGLLFTLPSCGDDDDAPTPPQTGDMVDLGSGDAGILNYAYALEQLEAAFYTQVIGASNFSSIFSSDEQTILTDLYNHEVIHREFFKAGLGSSAIIDLTVDFSSIDFNDRDSVLQTAQTFEDLGVSAYNGAGMLLTDANNLLVAGKIVSVEARHAAAIRSVFQSDAQAFASTADANGLDPARTPSQVLDMASAFIVDDIDASNLPS